MPELKTKIEVAIAVEGELEPKVVSLRPEATIADLLKALKAEGLQDLEEVSIEDEDEALDPKALLSEILKDAFRVLHVGKRGKIEVGVTFNGRRIEKAFRPSATLRKVTRWAVETLDLTGKPSDFQLKLDGVVQPPETHVGQIAKGRKTVELALVMKIKPQG